MRTATRKSLSAGIVLAFWMGTCAGAAEKRLTADAINAALPQAAETNKPSEKGNKRADAVLIKAQVLLDRAGFSPGAIDGVPGENFRKALAAYQQKNSIEPSGRLDQATWQALAGASAAPVVVEYKVTEKDAAGPFVRDIPSDFEKMALLPRLSYKNPQEALAERHHMSQSLLSALNPGRDLRKAGTTILVANVADDRVDPTRSSEDANAGRSKVKVASAESEKESSLGLVRVEVSKGEQTVRVLRGDSLIAFYPATVGSEDKPAPDGVTNVTRVVRDPPYRYNPEYKFKNQKATEPVEIKPGPNSPVGAVWIALSVEGYGIHGTPEPEKVGKSESNGCVRLTNWDALALAKLVKKDTEVVFVP